MLNMPECPEHPRTPEETEAPHDETKCPENRADDADDQGKFQHRAILFLLLCIEVENESNWTKDEGENKRDDRHLASRSVSFLDTR